MHIERFQIEKYCHEDERYYFSAQLSETIDLEYIRRYYHQKKRQALLINNCLLIKHNHKMINIFANGYCLLNRFSDLESGKSFLEDLIKQMDLGSKCSGNSSR